MPPVSSDVGVTDVVNGVCVQVIHKHFYLKRTEIMSQCEEWIADIQQYSNDKRVGRTMSHHAAALKVISLSQNTQTHTHTGTALLLLAESVPSV